MDRVDTTFFQISEGEFENKEHFNVYYLLKLLTDEKEKGYRCLHLSFYDAIFEKEAMYLDRGKCDYIKAIFNMYHYFFYFIVDDAMKLDFFYCIADVFVLKGRIIPKNKLKMLKLIDKIFNETIKYGIEINDRQRAIESVKFLNQAIKDTDIRVRNFKRNSCFE